MKPGPLVHFLTGPMLLSRMGSVNQNSLTHPNASSKYHDIFVSDVDKYLFILEVGGASDAVEKLLHGMGLKPPCVACAINPCCSTA